MVKIRQMIDLYCSIVNYTVGGKLNAFKGEKIGKIISDFGRARQENRAQGAQAVPF